MTAPAASDYGRYARPELMRRLEACRLDVVYHRAEGDLLFTRDDAGTEVEVLDMVGGFGVGLLGHNNPHLVGELRAALDAQAPFHAQGSHRATAGRLCRRLSEVVGASTGRRYLVTLANTGTEAVEAAIKHAELERDARLRELLDGYREHHRAIEEKLRNRECDLVPRVLKRVGERLGLPPGSDPDLDEIHHLVLAHNQRVAEASPLFLAIEGAYHGKTSGSLKLTYDHEVRLPFRRVGIAVRFLPRGDAAALAEAVRASTLKLLDLSVGAGGAVELVEREFINIAALFVEPIQGEGGIRELDPRYLAEAREVASRGGFPLVVDEIQSGCGRTGTFLASEQLGLVGDYVLLSKALGGGLTKVSACLIDSARYRERFGTLHTSTFGEDDFASRVALATLQLLTSADSDVLSRARRQGERIQGGLRELQRRYPEVIAGVRGRGLMIGLELAPQHDSPSPTVRLLSSQRFLGFAVAGFLLHEARVRVLPTLSQPETLRLEPSAYISDEQVEWFLAAVERMCRVCADARGDRLIRFLCADERPLGRDLALTPAPPPSDVGRLRVRPHRATSVPPYAGRVAFLGHFIRSGHLRHWDPGLSDYDDASLARFLGRTHRMLDPFESESAIIESAIGERVHLSFIGVPITPHQIQEAFAAGNIRWIEEKILAGVRLARRQGASLVGMGGYTSILTGQGTRISEDRVGITSGNAMTVAMGVEALMTSAAEAGIDLDGACLGAVGATGNICSLYAQMMAEHVPRMVLVGRPHMESRLRRVAGEVYFETYKLLQRLEDPTTARGLARVLHGSEAFERFRRQPDPAGRIGAQIHALIEEEMGDAAPIRVSSDLGDLTACQLIVSASSTAEPLIYPQHLGPGPRVICDLALPEDVAPAVMAARPDVRVVRGGIVRLPRSPDLVLAGMPLEPGCVFACMAETLLLGLSRINEHFSWGRVTKQHVEAIRDLGTYHGFRLERAAMTSVL